MSQHLHDRSGTEERAHGIRYRRAAVRSKPEEMETVGWWTGDPAAVSGSANDGNDAGRLSPRIIVPSDRKVARRHPLFPSSSLNLCGGDCRISKGRCG